MVPVGALRAVREELKHLKPIAERAAQLEQEVNQSRPYVEFLQRHPQLLNPQPAAPEPDPQDDPALVELARTLELYDSATGKPDVKRAETIRSMTRAEAQSIAQQEIAPMREATYEQKAGANLSSIMQSAKTADGAPLQEQYLKAAVQSITASLPRGEAVKVLADPAVANVIKLTALGLQASTQRSAPAAPASPALHVETAGGSSDVPMSEGSRRLARMTGIGEKQWQDTAKRYQPGRSNSLE